jgi:hypothetical protein
LKFSKKVIQRFDINLILFSFLTSIYMTNTIVTRACKVPNDTSHMTTAFQITRCCSALAIPCFNWITDKGKLNLGFIYWSVWVSIVYTYVYDSFIRIIHLNNIISISIRQSDDENTDNCIDWPRHNHIFIWIDIWIICIEWFIEFRGDALLKMLFKRHLTWKFLEKYIKR